MDRIIIKNAEPMDLIYKEMPSEDEELRGPRGRDDDNFKRHKLKRKKLRPEPGGPEELLLDGLGGDRSQFRGMGTEESFSIPGAPNGW